MRTADERLTRETLSGEALFILKNLRDNRSSGRSNKLADVKSTLEPSVTLEFDNYFFFLRKYNFIAMDREACLQLTGEGERVVDGSLRDRFGEAVSEYFASRLGESVDASRARPPPPPPMSDPNIPVPIRLQNVIEPEDAPVEATQVSTNNLPPDFSAPLPPPVASPFEAMPPPPPPSTQTKRPRTRPTTESEPLVSPPPRNLEVPRGSAGGELDGRFSKSGSMGSGPLGQVYKGRQLSTGVDVAIKELKDIFGYFSFLQRSEVMKRLRKELQAQAGVRHPGIVQVLDLNLDTARPYFVLELCSGSLRDEMTEVEGQGLKVEHAIRYFLQMCYGLRAAHAQGLTHQNLKPENVLIDQLGNAKLADFGLTRVIEVDSVKGMPQVIVGTGGMGYLPPELLAQQKGAGPSADVYSLGILFYEMLTGALPGRRSPLPSQARTEVPAQLDAIFDKMTQDKKEDRLPDVDAVLSEFYAAFSKNEWLKKGDLIMGSETAGAGAKTSAPAEDPA